MRGLVSLAKTKTFWGGIALIAYGLTQILQGNPNEGLHAVIEGVIVIFLRDAIRGVKDERDKL